MPVSLPRYTHTTLVTGEAGYFPFHIHVLFSYESLDLDDYFWLLDFMGPWWRECVWVWWVYDVFTTAMLVLMWGRGGHVCPPCLSPCFPRVCQCVSVYPGAGAPPSLISLWLTSLYFSQLGHGGGRRGGLVQLTQAGPVHNNNTILGPETGTAGDYTAGASSHKSNLFLPSSPSIQSSEVIILKRPMSILIAGYLDVLFCPISIWYIWSATEIFWIDIYINRY